MTAGVFITWKKANSSSSSQLRRRRRSVSATTSRIERVHPADDGIDGVVDMFEVGAEAEDRAAQPIAAVDLRTAHHHAAFLLDVPRELLVEFVDVAALRQVPEGNDREIRSRPWVPAVHSGQAGVEIASECELFGLGSAKRGNARYLQRQPQAQGA